MKNLIFLLSTCLLFTACKKSNDGNPPSGINCEALKLGIITNDETIVATEINAAASDLTPLAPTDADEYGQAQNINLLVQRLSQKCGIKATLLCYSCIETLPAQSEIRISFNQNGMVYDRVLDISVDEQRMLIFRAMHD
jgi:hypothetical protein